MLLWWIAGYAAALITFLVAVAVMASPQRGEAAMKVLTLLVRVALVTAPAAYVVARVAAGHL